MFSIILDELFIAPVRQPINPNEKIVPFLIAFQFRQPKSFQFMAVSMIHGYIIAREDTETEPIKVTNSSNQGIKAARASVKSVKAILIKIWALFAQTESLSEKCTLTISMRT